MSSFIYYCTLFPTYLYNLTVMSLGFELTDQNITLGFEDTSQCFLYFKDKMITR